MVTASVGVTCRDHIPSASILTTANTRQDPACSRACGIAAVVGGNWIAPRQEEAWTYQHLRRTGTTAARTTGRMPLYSVSAGWMYTLANEPRLRFDPAVNWSVERMIGRRQPASISTGFSRTRICAYPAKYSKRCCARRWRKSPPRHSRNRRHHGAVCRESSPGTDEAD